MKKIVLISCVSQKEKQKEKAKNLYKGPLFKNSLEYAVKLNPDKIYILSALNHVVDLEQEIEPYDVTLSYVSPEKRLNKPNLKVLSKKEAKSWGQIVIKELSQFTDIKNDRFIVLAGRNYIEPIKNDITHLDDQLKGLRYGERVKILKSKINEINSK